MYDLVIAKLEDGSELTDEDFDFILISLRELRTRRNLTVGWAFKPGTTRQHLWKNGVAVCNSRIMLINAALLQPEPIPDVPVCSTCTKGGRHK